MIFDYLNQKLFDNTLPNCMLNFSRRSKKTGGFFWSNRWVHNGGDVTHEISLNPKNLAEMGHKEIVAIIAHEMVHLWQHAYGRPSPNGYHNKEWANKMEFIGLIPSDSGEPGSKRTGRRISHYIQSGGRFERVFEVMSKEYLLPFLSSEPWYQKQRTDKVKYTCSGCGVNVWGKRGLTLFCGCGSAFECNLYLLKKALNITTG